MAHGDEGVIHFYLEARCSNLRVSTTRAVRVDNFSAYRDRGFFGLYEGTIRWMELDLGSYVEKMVNDASRSPSDE